VAWGDARRADLKGLVERTCDDRDWARPELPDPEPFTPGDPPQELDLSRFGAVVFATGYRPAYSEWIDIPGAFDEFGFPRHENGTSTVARGLHFAGVHFLRKRKSSLLIGVGEDAALVAAAIADRRSQVPG
jgi:putative flavoprotein involved in K+ transport